VDRARRLDEAYNQLCVLLRQQLTEGESYWSMLQALMSPEQFARFLQWTHTYGPVCIKINTFKIAFQAYCYVPSCVIHYFFPCCCYYDAALISQLFVH